METYLQRPFLCPARPARSPAAAVLFIDTHERTSVYPPPFLSGAASDVGEGAGRGATINVPLPRKFPHSLVCSCFLGYIPMHERPGLACSWLRLLGEAAKHWRCSSVWATTYLDPCLRCRHGAWRTPCSVPQLSPACLIHNLHSNTGLLLGPILFHPPPNCTLHLPTLQQQQQPSAAHSRNPLPNPCRLRRRGLHVVGV